MKNFLMNTFQGKVESKLETNLSKESKTKKIDLKKANVNNKNNINNIKTANKNTNKIIQKTKLSQEIMNSNLALIGQHPVTQNLTEENKNNKKDEIIKEQIKKDNFIKNNSNNYNNKNNNKINNNNKYKEPFKPIGQYIIDKTLRFEENKSKKNIKNNNKKEIKNDNTNNNNNNEFNSDEEDELIKSKRKKINKTLNLSKKKNKIRQGNSVVKNVINSIINEMTEIKKDEKDKNINLNSNKRKTISESKPKVQSGNFVRLNLKKKYQEKKRVRPINIRKKIMNHSKELYKYQKKTIKNSSTNNPYMGQGNTGLVDIDTLMKEQNDADKNDNNNLINSLVEKLPVFSQSYIEETQKTPLKSDNKDKDKDNNNKDKDNNNKDKDNNNKDTIDNDKNINNIIEVIDKTPMTNRLTTILKNSLKKNVSLDTELKFLSQEFKYLLSGQREKIIKLNEIKKETLFSKKPLQTINEEDKIINVNKTVENENILNDNIIEINENENENEMSKDDIEKMENEILLTVLKENFNHQTFNSELQLSRCCS
ncbi:hypothetical protein J6P11_01995 [bacterium]|nr:hypothetical protein [bacterium]